MQGEGSGEREEGGMAVKGGSRTRGVGLSFVGIEL